MKLNFNTIILYVQSIDIMKSFYIDTLRLEVEEDDQLIWVLLRAGNGYIGLHRAGKQYLSKNVKSSHTFDNNTKIVFEIQEDISKTRQLLISKNVLMKEIKTFDNYDYWLCDGEDPEGNVFQLKQRKLVKTE